MRINPETCMQYSQHLEPQETQSPKNQKRPLDIHPNLPKSTQSQQKNKPKNTNKSELHLKSKLKIQIKL